MVSIPVMGFGFPLLTFDFSLKVKKPVICRMGQDS
jgi:hypothetical protein